MSNILDKLRSSVAGLEMRERREDLSPGDYSDLTMYREAVAEIERLEGQVLDLQSRYDIAVETLVRQNKAAAE